MYEEYAFGDWLSDQMFRFELANRIINLFRSLLLVLILVKLFEVPNWAYVVIVLIYGLMCWLFGYIIDKTKFYKRIDKSYLRRSQLIDEIDEIKNGSSIH